jgi:hypothetical protein
MRALSFASQVDPGSSEMVQAIEIMLMARSGIHKLTRATP